MPANGQHTENQSNKRTADMHQEVFKRSQPLTGQHKVQVFSQNRRQCGKGTEKTGDDKKSDGWTDFRPVESQARAIPIR